MTENKQRVVLTRQLGDGSQMTFEALVDEADSAEQIYQSLIRVDAASERLRAKSELILHFGRMLEVANDIEALIKLDVADWAALGSRENGAPCPMTGEQVKQRSDDLRGLWEHLAGIEMAVAECRQIIEGEAPIAVIGRRVTARIDKLRCGSAEFPLSPLCQGFWRRADA